MKAWFAIDLWKRVMLGLVLGAITGLVLRQVLGNDEAAANVTAWAKPIGDAFISLIKMLVVPLISRRLCRAFWRWATPRNWAASAAGRWRCTWAPL
jgi:L-cystine uptake protein TcyP (sodium:dicarboxylate symporter family)